MMKNNNIFMKGSTFEPIFSASEQARGVRYVVATYGNLKATPTKPKHYGQYLQNKHSHK